MLFGQGSKAMVQVTLIAFSISAMLLFFPTTGAVSPTGQDTEVHLVISRIAAVVSVAIWLFFMAYRHVTHRYTFDENIEYSRRGPFRDFTWGPFEDLVESTQLAWRHFLLSLGSPRSVPNQTMVYEDIDGLPSRASQQRNRSHRPQLRRNRRFSGDPGIWIEPEFQDKHLEPLSKQEFASLLLFLFPRWIFHMFVALCRFALRKRTLYICLLIYCIDSLVTILLSFQPKVQALLCLFGVPLLLDSPTYLEAVVGAIRQDLSSDDLNGAIDTTLGTGVCVALAVGPILVIAGWILSLPMTLMFNEVETMAYGIAVWILTIFVHDGISNYYKASLLIGMYIILAMGLVISL